MSEQGRMQALFRSSITSLGRATGWREVIRTAQDIRAMGKGLRTHEDEATSSADLQFDVPAIAARHGLTPTEVERRLVNRRRQTSSMARVYLAGLVLTLTDLVVTISNHGWSLLSAAWLTGMSGVLLLGYVSNALSNWQLRVRHPVFVSDFLRHPSEWWAS